MRHIHEISATLDTSGYKREKTPISLMKLVSCLVILLTCYIVITPLFMLLYSSVGSAKGKLPFESFSFSLANYAEALGNPAFLKIVMNSLYFTAGSMAIGISLAVVLAWILERTDMPGKTVIYGLIMIPMAIPNMIYAISWTQLMDSKIGMLNQLIRPLFGLETGPFSIYTLGGMIFVQGIHMVPTALLMIAATFATMDPTLEEQSALCGKGMMTTIRRISLPILKPSLLAAIIYFAVVAIETFEIPATLGLTARTPVLATQIYWATHPASGKLPDYGVASALGVILLVFALVLISIYQRSTRNAEKYTTITGKAYRPKQLELGKWKPAAFIFVWLFIILTVFAPFLTLLWTSLHEFYVPFSWTGLQSVSANAYRAVLQRPDLPMVAWNTVLMTVASGMLTVLMATLIGWIVVRGPFSRRTRQLVDAVSFIPQAVPAVVIGLSLMFLYIRFPLPIYGTIVILIIGMITKYLAFGSRTMISAQLQISKELEEASLISGASWSRTMRKVLMPLLTPAILTCFIWIAVHAMRELSIVIMLYSPKTLVLSTTVWNLWEGGWTAEASVLGVFMIVLLGLLFFGGQVLVRRLTGTR